MSVYLDYHKNAIHDCKTHEPLGAGITKCGRTFLTGDHGLKRDQQFDDPPPEGVDEAWHQCERCKVESYKQHATKWYRWKGIMGATVKAISESIAKATGKEADNA